MLPCFAKMHYVRKHDFQKREKNDKMQNGSGFGVIICYEASSFLSDKN